MPIARGTSAEDGVFSPLHQSQLLFYQEIPQEISRLEFPYSNCNSGGTSRQNSNCHNQKSRGNQKPGRGLPIIKFRHLALVFLHLGSLLALVLTLFLASAGLPVIPVASAQELSDLLATMSSENFQVTQAGISESIRSRRSMSSAQPSSHSHIQSHSQSHSHSHSSHSSAPTGNQYSPPFRLASAAYDTWWRILNRRSAMENHHPQCLVLDKNTVTYLCRLDPWKRLENFRKYLVLPNVTETSSEVYLYGLFMLHRVRWKTESDLTLSNLNHLREGVHSTDCIMGEAESDRCLNCMWGLLNRTEQIRDAFISFNASLSSFDCSLNKFTQRFTPNSTCERCLAWYQRWLIISLMSGGSEGLWKDPPCPNECEKAELSCPHLSSIQQFDYAGLPSFRCTDTKIVSQSTVADTAKCISTCDIVTAFNDSSHCPQSRTSPLQNGPSVSGGVPSCKTETSMVLLFACLITDYLITLFMDGHESSTDVT